jgi:(2R)-sulfolactate sulfo-lyase subunit alpha
MLLHPEDNVYVCRSPFAAGDILVIDGDSIRIGADIAMGHKVSRFHLDVGAKVRKYGVPIGTITVAVNRGEHVHLQNMTGDYFPSHARDAAGREDNS